MTAEMADCKCTIALPPTKERHPFVWQWNWQVEASTASLGVGHGTLEDKKVFCSNITVGVTANPVAYEDDEAVVVNQSMIPRI